MSPRYRLIYFDARGVAERARLMFAIAGVEYEDFRYGFRFDRPGDYSTMCRPEFEADKNSGKFTPSCGRLPILVVDGVFVA